MFEKIAIRPGLMILRFRQQDRPSNAIIRPVVAPEDRNDVTVVFDPTRTSQTLNAPGDVCVIQCRRATELGIDIASRDPAHPARGSVELEHLGRAQAARPDPAAKFMSFDDDPGDAGAITCLAHIAFIGDRRAQAGDWLRGDAPAHSIEGLQFHCPEDAPVFARDLTNDQIAAPGEFLGSRGQKRALAALELWLEGDDQGAELQVEALFENAGFVERRGRHLTIEGLGRTDKLLGLRLDVGAAETDGAEALPYPPNRAKGGSERVKIYYKPRDK